MSTIDPSPNEYESLINMPLTLLRASPTNPRKRFTQAKIDELADSIKKHGGVFQPILVRPNPDAREGDGQPPFEIVCGERRFRASKQAELTTVLALRRTLTDFEALEIQLLENIERDDLHPLEEAEGLRKLLREPKGLQGYATAEELAQRIGKSRRWVFKRLALLNLCDDAKAAFLDEKISASVAGLIARMPNAEQQAEATKKIVEGFGGEPYTHRAAEAYLQQHFMLDLARAPFDVVAIFQVAGPCGSCQKRSGANPELFDDVKSGDLCQDSECFQAKAAEAREAKLAAARDAGHTVVAGNAALQLLPVAGSLPAGYHWLDEPCPALTASTKPLRELFGAKVRDAITVDQPRGAVVAIVPDASVRKLLKSKGLLRQEPPAPPTPKISQAAATVEPPKAQPGKPGPATAAKAPPQPPAKPRTEQQLAAAVDAKEANLLPQMLFKRLADALGAVEVPPLLILRLAICKIMEHASAEAFQLLLTSMGWNVPEKVYEYEQELARQLEGLDGSRLAEVLGLALCAEDLSEPLDLDDMLDDAADARALAQAMQIDPHALQTEARAAAIEMVEAEEARRLGKAPQQDATASFVAAHAPAPTQGQRAPLKYRNAATGETWSGRGLQPKWLKVALAAGARLDDFAVQPAAAVEA